MQNVHVSTTPRVRETLAAYLNLAKPHVTVMLLVVTLAAMAVAAPTMPGPQIVLATLLAGAMAAASANAINCYWDRDIDLVMRRTQRRTLPAGRVPEQHALIFGIGMGIASTAIFAIFVNALSAALSLAAILFYVGIYTIWLKRSTPQNIVIGGAAGAVPVLIGWAAATGSVTLPALWLFLIIFFWTPPHFWALALVLKQDYARAGVPMLPVVQGEQETYRQILLYTLVLVASSLMLVPLRTLGYLYLVAALLLGGALLVLALRLSWHKTLRQARELFWFSNYYLAFLFVAMVVDHVLR